ncbi:DUF2807 domain-containing protein [bacterium]|nr:DUF2807 domain-containing protein [bacterium]
MKNIILISLSVLFFSSCVKDRIRIKPSSNITTVETSAGSFDELQVEDAMQVFVSFTNANESIKVEANDNLHEFIEINNIDGRLEVGLERGVSIRGNATLKVHIFTNNIHTYDISGASSVDLRSFWSGENLRVDASGASYFEGAIDATNLNLDLSGASNADLRGNVQNMKAEASGASTIRDFDLEVEDLNLDLSGASNADLTVNNSIILEASGASTLRYRGNPSIESLNLSGASNIKKD